MNQGEPVTMFNDMCVMATATLIDPTTVGISRRPNRAGEFHKRRPHDSVELSFQRPVNRRTSGPTSLPDLA
jgi:hypothetical protein